MHTGDPFGWVGSIIDGQFAVEAPAGEGAFGIVYRGRHLGFDVGEARVGRLVDVDVDAEDRADALAQLERMCEQLLANPLIESYEIALEQP